MGEWVTTLAPTCTEVGTQQRTCSAEGCEYTETQIVAKLGHDFAEGYTVDVAATCHSVGSKSQHCTRENCTAVTGEQVIPMTAHALSAWEVSVAPTCTENGTATQTCSNKGCTYSATQVIEKLGHTMGEWVTTLAPTCTEVGTQQRTCMTEGCAHTETQILEKLGHDFAKDYTVDAEATCHSEGSASKHCARCDAVTDVIAIAKPEHTYDQGTVTIPASANREGIMTYTCQACDHIKTEMLPKLPPEMVEQPEEHWTTWSDDEVAVFRSNAAYEDFQAVMINGEVLSPEFYTIREGSIIVEIKGDYLKGLKNGDYTVDIVSSTGTATSTLTIKKNFITRPAVWIPTVSAVALIILVLAIIFMVRKKSELKALFAKKK